MKATLSPPSPAPQSVEGGKDPPRHGAMDEDEQDSTRPTLSAGSSQPGGKPVPKCSSSDPLPTGGILRANR